ncbi:DUF4468 domain-containing protein [Hymenobacter volaticus]|uniref:DUF4468 domain-containing protein n=1 Tax=Hymenobacter volaticus TaxID=2932254 RepID=A0ABY4G0N3_9BACT|nr:DUF4468 domain-containing protein [Hymenobacter volaticus]UOQ64424.1 DUF4468 domain-containing protein [Hymenobacter volaticus]
MAANSNATVVGHYSPRWLVVKRQGFLYLAPSAMLFSPDGPTRLLDGTVLPFDSDTKRISYQGVVEVPGTTKDQLYVRAYEWLAKTYRSANAVIQMQDKEAGRLVGKGVMKVTLRGFNAGYVQHTITIYLKDGRYKYILTDFAHEAGGAKDVYSAGPLERPDGEVMAFGDKKTWDKVRRDATADAELLIKDLQAAMTVKAGKDPSDF